MSVIEFLTLLAIFVGPIAAVLVTRFIDARREMTHRRREVLANLMRTRRFKLSPDHVSALNLIQLEFYKATRVVTAYENYISHLAMPVPTGEHEQKAFFDRREDLFVDLVHSMAQALKYRLDKRDLEKLAYGPVGWENDELEARAVRRTLLEILSGRRPFPVFSWQLPNANGPFPPAPALEPPGKESE